ncbi:TetR/AcrR family transcriptional regulator [Microbacterium sp. ASV49]|uniref:Helix-turn-helix domain-containing protein n=1 Tax=Microbacterium candidum TaxID=3041922 RepID=A0ABT7N337_9MICO|nr:TetR/AcrR family transcriptional regulator [Microbacterium sp. ASV49]MDL9981128.1 helix-turn-helix domain-containing protein [Microbacterium sp. ASV49]
MNTPREYDMTLRAEQAAQTRVRILDALTALVAEIPLAAVTLPRVADRAGVTVQTVLRNFGSRDGLFAAGLEFGRDAVVAERTITPDDVDASLAALVDHYERTSTMTLLLLGQESWEPIAAEVTAGGKALHRDWVERVFAHALDDAADRDEATDLLVVATDLYCYKLLRLDRALSRDRTLQRMRRLVQAVLDTL